MMKADLKPRTTGQTHKLTREEFMERFHAKFHDPNFDKVRKNIEEIGQIAWENYQEGRKAPNTQPAGENYTDPNYQLSIDWINAKKDIEIAQKLHDDQTLKSNVLLIIASDRNEGTCPGEYSKTSRLAHAAQKVLEEEALKVEVLDLSLITAEYGKNIFPCKGCVSTAMPLCHWPCSCYPNHSLNQTNDWMNEIYSKWVRAHGVMIITPVYWHQAPSALKLMMDRLVCADGGNDDPTSTQGKKAEIAKKIEMDGWHYPRHLKGRIYSVIVHGDAVGIETLRNNLAGWLDDMRLLPAPPLSQLARYIGYYEPYAISHQALDKDYALFTEVENAARGLALTIEHIRKEGLEAFTPRVKEPRPK